MEDEAQLRKDVREALAKKNVPVLLHGLRKLWLNFPSPSVAGMVEQVNKSCPLPKQRTVRLAVVRSFTVEPVVQQSASIAKLWGLDVETFLGGFDGYMQEVLNPKSDLYAFEPDVLVCALSPRSLCPDLWDSVHVWDEARIQARQREVVGVFESLLRTFRKHSQATIFVHLLELPPLPAAGMGDAQAVLGQRAVFEGINAEMIALVREVGSAFVVDVPSLAAQLGVRQWWDEARWFSMRLPYTAAAVALLAQSHLQCLVGCLSAPLKVLICDLDNTLWGGVVGEVGPEGVLIGSDYKGEGFRLLQQHLLHLKACGYLLAVCSKNNESDVWEVFERVPAMLLKKEDFVQVRINWEDKAANILSIAQSLNVGLDACVFLDDSPHECARVREALPEVHVIDLDAHSPMAHALRLKNYPGLTRLSISQEDRVRSERYHEQAQREQLRDTVGTLEEYYKSLDMQLEQPPCEALVLERLAQLVERTNQFNLTTRRHTLALLKDYAEDAQWDVMAFALTDRFGDQGVVGCVLGCAQGEDYVVDTFLMSCRVIGRTFEQAMLACVGERARERGMRRVVLEYIKTSKNQPVEAFLGSFNALGDGRVYRLPLEDLPDFPQWIARA